MTREHQEVETMPPLTGTIHGGQIVPDAPLDLPEGTRVDITPRVAPGDKVGLEPSEWRNDAAALADWASWIKTFEPIELPPAEEAELAQFREAMRQFNTEAVRRQMEEGGQ